MGSYVKLHSLDTSLSLRSDVEVHFEVYLSHQWANLNVLIRLERVVSTSGNKRKRIEKDMRFNGNHALDLGLWLMEDFLKRNTELTLYDIVTDDKGDYYTDFDMYLRDKVDEIIFQEILKSMSCSMNTVGDNRKWVEIMVECDYFTSKELYHISQLDNFLS